MYKMFKPVLTKIKEMKVVLASNSKQRINLLNSVNLKFETCASTFEENLNPSEHSFSDFVEKTALGKAREVHDRLEASESGADLVIGADTMVTFGGKMFGKPKDKHDAIRMITELTRTGLPNVVYTGVVVIYKDKIYKFTEATSVYMSKLTDEEVRAYVETGEPDGKAGGYALQGIASTFIEKIEGDFNNVIGLPLCRLSQLFKQILTEDGLIS